MGIYWICDRTGERFDDYDAAQEDYQEKLWLDDLADHFHNYVSYDSLFNWAIKQDAFWNDAKMQDYYDRADSDCFNDQYIEHDEEEDERYDHFYEKAEKENL